MSQQCSFDDVMETTLPEFTVADMQHDHGAHISENRWAAGCQLCWDYWTAKGRKYENRRRNLAAIYGSACVACRENH